MRRLTLLKGREAERIHKKRFGTDWPAEVIIDTMTSERVNVNSGYH